MSLRTSGGDLDSLASHTIGVSRYEEHADRAVVEASRHDEETGFEALIDHRLHAVENESVAVGAGGSERLAGRGALLVERRSAKQRAFGDARQPGGLLGIGAELGDRHRPHDDRGEERDRRGVVAGDLQGHRRGEEAESCAAMGLGDRGTDHTGFGEGGPASQST